jgi:ATP-dependent helicase/nuclease subunit B
VKALLIPESGSLVDEAARRIAESSLPPARIIVVFPGKRPAHFLRQRLAEGRKVGFLPPRILSMDQMVDAAFEARCARQGVVLPKAEAIDAVALLYDIQKEESEPLGGAAFMALDSFLGLGLKIARDVEELAIERVPARKVAEVQTLIEEGVPEPTRKRLATLSRFCERFHLKIAEANLSTRSSRYVEVGSTIEQGDLGEFDLLLLAGFSTLTRAEKDIFARVGAWPQAEFFFQDGPGMREKLESLGVRHPAVTVQGSGPADASAGPPEVRLVNSPDSHGQVFALNAVLDSPDERTVIVLPAADTLFPLLRHCLSRFEESSYNISLGYPLLRTPLFGFLSSLMELVSTRDGGRMYLPAYMSFVLHPYTKNIRFRSSAESTRVLFHVLEENLAQSRARRFATLEEIESDQTLFRDAAARIARDEDPAKVEAELRSHLVRIHDRTVRAFLAFPTIRAFAEAVIALIEWIHEASTARDHPLFTPFAESFLQTLGAISRSLIGTKSFTGIEGYFALLRRYLQTCYHPFAGTPLHGMQVLGALETRNLRFDRVFVLDANEGVLPEAGASGTMLPFAVRKALGLSTAQDQEQIAALHFAQLKAGARELHMFSVESGDKERSRFAERALWEMQSRQGSLEVPGLVRTIQYRVSLGAKAPAPVEKTAAIVQWLRLREHSATALNDYLRCPLAYYYRHVLKLGRREETTGEVEPVDIGSFVHSVLFEHFRERTGRRLLPADADPDGLAALALRMFPATFGDAEAGANRLLRNQVAAHLGDFAAGYLEPLFSAHAVEMKSLEHRVTASRGGFALRGTIDAVLVRDGRHVLLDYKTSAHRAAHTLRADKLSVEDRAGWAAAMPTLQLPFYVLLYSAATGIPAAEIGAAFLLLGRTQIDEKIEVPLFTEKAKPGETWPVLEAVIFGLLGELASPDVPFMPAADPAKACRYCDFTGMCGTGSARARGT